jgi:hypothetical protein
MVTTFGVTTELEVALLFEGKETSLRYLPGLTGSIVLRQDTHPDF